MIAFNSSSEDSTPSTETTTLTKSFLLNLVFRAKWTFPDTVPPVDPVAAFALVASATCAAEVEFAMAALANTATAIANPRTTLVVRITRFSFLHVSQPNRLFLPLPASGPRALARAQYAPSMDVELKLATPHRIEDGGPLARSGLPEVFPFQPYIHLYIDSLNNAPPIARQALP